MCETLLWMCLIRCLDLRSDDVRRSLKWNEDGGKQIQLVFFNEIHSIWVSLKDQGQGQLRVQKSETLLPTRNGDRMFKAPNAKAQATLAFREAECTMVLKHGLVHLSLSPGAVTVVLEMPSSVVNFTYRQALSIPWNSLFIKISDVSFFLFHPVLRDCLSDF